MSGPLAGRLPWIAMALLVVALDRSTKLMVEARLEPYRSVTVIPGLFDLTYVRNPGGVFGILKGVDDWVRGVLFTVIPMAAILLIVAYARKIPASRRITQASLALILGGAAGNLLDRLRHGYVIDFLDVYWRDHHWPAFNVADSAICIGVALLMIETFLVGEPAAPAPAGGETDRVARDAP